MDKLLQVAPYVPRQNATLRNIEIQTKAKSSSVKRKDVLLVIEGDENISQAINEYFSRAGFNVVLVDYGPTTVVDAVSARPNVIVLGMTQTWTG